MNNSWCWAVARKAAAAVLLLACVGAAHATALRAYMSAATEPFQDSSNYDAMSAAFGPNVGTDWDRLQYSDGFTGYRMLYIDGGGADAFEMASFLDGNRSALQAYVLGGGRLFINAATDFLTSVELVFGAILNEQSLNSRGSTGFAVDGGSALFSGAGTSWEGGFFSHDDISLAAGYSPLIVDDAGRTVLAGGVFGQGYVMLGGQTNTAFQFGVNGSDPFQLRVNELRYVDQVDTTGPTPMPEPGSLALILVAGLAMRQSLRTRRG
jgi:hypothetical protein